MDCIRRNLSIGGKKPIAFKTRQSDFHSLQLFYTPKECLVWIDHHRQCVQIARVRDFTIWLSLSYSRLKQLTDHQRNIHPTNEIS